MPPKGEAAASSSTAAAGARGKKGAAEAGTGPDSKRVKKRDKRYKKATANQVSSIIPTLVKAVAQAMSRTRELEEVAYDVELFTKSSLGWEAMKKRTTEWAKTVKEKGRGHGQGPPHLQTWVGLCEGLLDNGLEIGMSNREKLTEFFTRYKEWSLEDQRLAVRFCRSRPAYEKGHTKIIGALRGKLEDMRSLLVLAMSQVGGELKSGRAPRSGMEWALQTFLDCLETEEEVFGEDPWPEGPPDFMEFGTVPG